MSSPGGWVDGAGELKLELEVLIVKVVDLDNGSVGFVFNLERVSKHTRNCHGSPSSDRPAVPVLL